MRVLIRKFSVVDSNSRSRGGDRGLAAVLESAAAGHAAPPLIPDALVYEMMKAKGSARAWAKLLAEHPEHFAMARAPGQIVRDELAGIDDPSFIYQEGTAAVRDFVEDYRDNGEPALDKQVADSRRGLREISGADGMFNVGFVRSISQEAIDQIVESLPAEVVAALKDSDRRGVPEGERMSLKKQVVIHQPSLDLIAVHMGRNDSEDRALLDLARRATFVRAGLLMTLAEIAHDLELNRVVRGLADKNLINDAVDSQGVLLSALCDDFLTHDKRSLGMHELVRHGMDLPPGKLSDQNLRIAS